MMPQLIDFPGKTRHFNIAVEIGVNYSAVGTALLNDERGTLLPAIVSQHRENAEQINMDILSRWVQGKGMADRTWRGLLNVLRVHCPALAQDIEETLRAEEGSNASCSSMEPPVKRRKKDNTMDKIVTSAEMSGHTHAQPHSTLSHFSDELRAKYAKYPCPNFSNPHCHKWTVMDSQYIHPDIIDKKVQEQQPDTQNKTVVRQRQPHSNKNDGGTAVQLVELLSVRSGEKCRCLLVEGAPGIGKSTLAWQVCHLWGKRELFNQYSTVLLLPLRDERVQEATQVEDLFLQLKEKKDREEVVQEMGGGNGTLVILDGLDELPDHLLSKQTIFTDLLSGEVLTDATLLVTSRPSATQQLLTRWKQRISKHLIIRGFSENDIQHYIKTILSGEKLTEFQKYLSIHPHIQAIMYVPLHSAIVMTVYLQSKQLPKTVTRLYTWLVKIILSHHVTDHPEYEGEDEVHDKTLNLNLPSQVYDYFKELCMFAYKNVCSQQLMFSNLQKELHNLGFTDSVPELFLPGSATYNFLHLTIQEYLGAYHVSHMSSCEKEQLLLKSRTGEGVHLRNMMRFIAGLTKFEGYSSKILKQIIDVKYQHSVDIVDEYFDVQSVLTDGTMLDEYSLELLYECQDVSSLSRECTYTIGLNGALAELHLFLATGYCIANSTCTWNLILGNMEDATSVALLIQGLQDSVTHPNYTIANIDLFQVNAELLPQVPVPFLERIKGLSGLVTEMIIYPIEDHMKSKRLNTEFINQLCQWLPSCHLETLAIEQLSPENMVLLSQAITAATSLKKLDLSGTKTFTLQNMRTFASTLPQNQSLTNLKISSCSIDSDTACCLADALHNNTALRELKMNVNPVGNRGAVAMAEMLKHNTTLRVLDLSLSSIGDEGALVIARVLQHNTTLESLNISRNSVGERGTLAMAEMLKCNTALRVLKMPAGCVVLKFNLGEITILGNIKLRTEGIEAAPELGEWETLEVAKLLINNETVRLLSIGDELKAALEMNDKYKIAREVRRLLCEDIMGPKAVRALVESLAVNCHLRKLILTSEHKKFVENLSVYHNNKDRVDFSPP